MSYVDERYGDVKPITEKDKVIPGAYWDPHYTDERFTGTRDEGLSIFVDPSVTIIRSFGGDVGEGLTYDYNDRISQWLGYKALRNIREEVAGDGIEQKTARFIERTLQLVFKNDELWLGHIKAGVNRSNGYSYQIYGHRTQE